MRKHIINALFLIVSLNTWSMESGNGSESGSRHDDPSSCVPMSFSPCIIIPKDGPCGGLSFSRRRTSLGTTIIFYACQLSGRDLSSSETSSTENTPQRKTSSGTTIIAHACYLSGGDLSSSETSSTENTPRSSTA